MALLYGRAGHLTVQTGGFRPGQRELEEERSARRLLEKVLLKMAEEQTLKVVEQAMHKEKLARDAANKKLKDYVDLVHEKLTVRPGARGSRGVSRGSSSPKPLSPPHPHGLA
jgi:hypothetical protein